MLEVNLFNINKVFEGNPVSKCIIMAIKISAQKEKFLSAYLISDRHVVFHQITLWDEDFFPLFTYIVAF